MIDCASRSSVDWVQVKSSSLLPSLEHGIAQLRGGKPLNFRFGVQCTSILPDGLEAATPVRAPNGIGNVEVVARGPTDARCG
jgi:hypothetical protein